ncbi:MAG TPA: phosphate signaling complex protein PhoU [Blastocatellia bacterium]|jgi:phosphate transport system protein|nr:phosphate signaling complex protein PhoU [Blastocatellia bacterium]
MHRRLIEDELTRLRDKLLIMSGATEKAIALAVQSLTERDSDRALRVIREDDLIDHMELEIDAMCVDILVLKQPAASDLRFVVSIARAAPTVERIADHAVNIAKHALSLNDLPDLDMRIDVARMAKDVQDMLVDGLDAFTSGDPEKARSTIARDDEVDVQYDVLYAKVIEVMTNDPSMVARGAEWLFVLKHLERIADYVTNICEQIVYMARGQVIKHTIW